MFVAGLRAREHFPPLSWLGLALAVAGLVYLVSPGLTAPSPLGAGLMAVAGIAWGLYSLHGRGVADPLGATAGNFARAVPFALVVSLVFVPDFALTAEGVMLAIASGALASGLGYVIWYAALRRLSATRAATVQLSVPVIAAFGGVLLLSEAITLRLLASTAATLAGIALALAQRRGPAERKA
jgi:drug/metabolite transporter (DMT)-like permease